MALIDYLKKPNLQKMTKDRDTGVITFDEFDAIAYIRASRVKGAHCPRFEDLRPNVQRIVTELQKEA